MNLKHKRFSFYERLFADLDKKHFRRRSCKMGRSLFNAREAQTGLGYTEYFGNGRGTGSAYCNILDSSFGVGKENHLLSDYRNSSGCSNKTGCSSGSADGFGNGSLIVRISCTGSG